MPSRYGHSISQVILTTNKLPSIQRYNISDIQHRRKKFCMNNTLKDSSSIIKNLQPRAKPWILRLDKKPLCTPKFTNFRIKHSQLQVDTARHRCSSSSIIQKASPPLDMVYIQHDWFRLDRRPKASAAAVVPEVSRSQHTDADAPARENIYTTMPRELLLNTHPIGSHRWWKCRAALFVFSYTRSAPMFPSNLPPESRLPA